MAPPFIAYFGALQDDDGGQALLQIAYDQIRLYRDALFDEDVSLWRHITLGSWQDTGYWATGAQALNYLSNKDQHSHFWPGCGWAAAGAMRVLATINNSRYATIMQSQQNDLAQWVNEILTGVWQYQVRY